MLQGYCSIGAALPSVGPRPALYSGAVGWVGSTGLPGPLDQADCMEEHISSPATAPTSLTSAKVWRNAGLGPGCGAPARTER